MKRILYASFFAACAALSLASCMNGDYDADPNNVSTTTNPLNQGQNGGGGSGGNSSFNWNGSDPMSAKVNGTGWQAAEFTYLPSMQGFPASVVGKAGDKSAITIQLPTNPTINSTYSFGSNLTGSYSVNIESSDPDNVYSAGLGGGGQIQITEDDATHIKGKFYFSGKNIGGQTRTISEGYFNVTK